eukprot:GCRY01000588.1.p1 GENE.GCRY01000588.1~~GCRY01000588.1.p1  ORF type:complete len:216 (+),score=32.80 GCRY01000588.1:661-1308(+)
MTHKKLIEHELEGFGIRLNASPPNIYFKKKDKGGINFTHTCKQVTYLDLDTIKSVCNEYRIHNADITLKDDCTVDEFVDVIEGNRVYIPAVFALNKIDAITVEELDVLDSLPHYVPISAHLSWNLDELLERLWDYLSLTRVYTKPKGQIPDYDEPVVLRRGKTTVEDFCNQIHKTLMKEFKYALVWGTSAKHNPQRVGKDHVLDDEDIVQIVKKI